MTFKDLSRALFLAVFGAACAVPAHADSFASSASSAGSASSASISDSLSSSSDSSGDKDKVAAGEYRVIQIAQAPNKPDTTRMVLRATGADAGSRAAREFTLDVPNRALAARAVAAGDAVQVSQRVYGFEFAYADTRRAFFLALQDDWYDELGARKVVI